MNIIEGTTHTYGDNISTDLIIASRHLTKFLSHEELGKYALEALDPNFARSVKEGDILVIGKNFGWGSSREEAIIALISCGLKMVIAESFSRTFFRNGINRGGIYLVECPGITKDIKSGHTIKVNLEDGTIIDKETQKCLNIIPPPSFVQKIISSGGLLKFIAQDSDVRKRV
jgi:3-isopropylmalate/(R)-2-methylmalate dehydratase small subunit